MVFRLDKHYIQSETQLSHTLDLSKQSLHRKSGLALGQDLSKVDDNVYTLDLSENELYRKSGTELAFAFNKIRNSVTVLRLRKNGFDIQSGIELARAIAAIPCHIQELDLGENCIGDKSTDEIVKIISAIPKGVSILCFRSNELQKKSKDEMRYICSALPKHLTKLDLSGNKLGSTIEDMLFMHEILPAHMPYVAFENGQFISRAALMIAAPMLLSIHFDKHLLLIQTKALEMAEKARSMNANFQNAATVAKQLQHQLVQAKIAFLQDGGDQKSFKTACLSAINQARPILEKDGGWTKHLLSNFGIANFVTRKLGFFHAPKGNTRTLEDFELAINKPKIG